MILIDTSVVVQLLRDRTGVAAKNWRKLTTRQEFVLCRACQLELLQGARNDTEWDELDAYLDGQDYIEMEPSHWRDAARIFYELRRSGLMVRSVIDCLIAQIAIENRLTLAHQDRDFEVIHRVRPALRQKRVDLLA